jgi:DNA polymerase V
VLALITPPVRAGTTGFPSPAEDYIEKKLDLNHQLIKRPAATFLIRAVGDSMIGAGIHSGDTLIVDRSERARHGQVVIAVLNGELTVKRINLKGKKPQLLPENPAHKPIQIDELADVKIWGVVKHVIHSF